jgi:CRISPR-associated protein Cmr1
MKSATFDLELITPCFCGGAEPEKQAEIRAPSIRGQLRWWFRTLAGFKSLAPKETRAQEAMMFGSVAKGEEQAGKLMVRVHPPAKGKLTDSAEHPKPDMNQPEGYLLFPMRQRMRKKSALFFFRLTVLWRGDPSYWDDIRALVVVLGHLGSIGFRSRRAMGALAFHENAPDLKGALNRFREPENVLVKEIRPKGLMERERCISTLAEWLKGWRQHGRTPGLARNQPGFHYARRDHNEGLNILGKRIGNSDPEKPNGQPGQTFRPALGLPIIQFFSSLSKGGPNKVNWDWEYNPSNKKGEGRFASPILLRPHRDRAAKWHALVIFVEAHKWPDRQPVYLNGQKRAVSPDLYNAMKNDPGLQDFP